MTSEAKGATNTDIDARAKERLRSDEAAMTGSRRKSLPLSGAWREFWRHPSPWFIGTTLVGALVVRLFVGDWQLTDAILPVIMVAAFPFVEWIVHVVVLHWKPRTIGKVTLDPLVSRKHREHHTDPRDVPLVFIPWPVLAWLLPANTAIALFAFSRLGLGLTFLTALAAIGLVYEWTHYLIHSDYRPRSRIYRAIWRNHRLHHYKNEHYWFTVTTSGTADRVFGTYPKPGDISTSPTVKALHAKETTTR
ncbi:sterol desaturase family protein [Haloechinothrix halophila]|uniref:sterol desaturase family protein n=1 Tax=Haloechinothrix halophila TaxID=1069073 RepID=UPI0003FA71A4|nr:sterol desaturase family protein [Haloechinothrix halophila]